jgi:hypothetical protein
VPALLPGVYEIKVERNGFTTHRRTDVELQTGQVAKLDFTLQVGNVSEVVEVAAGAPVLETETTTVGAVIENKRIVELPLNGRNYLQLASLIPGATTYGPASSQGQQRMGGARNSFALNVSGQRVHFNHYTLDGIENTDPNFNTYLFLPSIDALQEFKVEAGTFQAEHGRAISQVMVSTKSGTNQLHGTAFEFLRNAKLDAKNFFDSPNEPIPPFKRNQFGFTAGGPVVIPKVIDGRNKLFFMGNYEGLRERKALTLTGTMPTEAMRSGNLSHVTRPITDPFTGETFAGNIIPASRIDATSATVLREFFPLPNRSSRFEANNFLNPESRRSDADQFTIRGDWVHSTASNFLFRYSRGKDTQYVPGLYTPAPNQGNNVNVSTHQGIIGHTLVIGSNKVNEFKFGVSRLSGENIQQRAFQQNVVEQLKIPDVSQEPLFWGIPVFSITGASVVGECNDCPFVNHDTVFQWTDNFGWTVGKHSFKMGTDLRRTRYNQIGAVVPRGRFGWNGQFTGDPMADFLLGYMSNTEGQVGAPIANFRNYYLSFYFQDAWKITPKLTVNWGIRWENEPPYLDKHDAIVNIDFRWDHAYEPVYVRAGTGDPFEGNPAFPLPPDVQYVRDGRFGRRATRNDLNDWAPRLGIAYSITPKTVIRAGAGIYYVRDIGNAVFDVVRNAPFTIRRNEPANQRIPNLSWSVPFTQLGAPTFILANQWDEPTSYVNQWSFNIQRELTRSMSLEVGYLGSSGVKLRRLQTYNNAPPGAGNITARRPFPKFGGFQVMNAPSHSSYHALQARLQHRFDYGFTFLGAYTYSKSIDNGSGIRTTDGDPLTPSDDYNLAAERGLSAFDFRQRFTASFLYELPFGRGKAWLSDAPGIVEGILGGWQFGGILTLQTGFPLTPYCGGGNIQNGGGYCKPDVVPGENPDLSHEQQRVERFFNTGAFVDRLGQDPARVTEFRYGNAGRNIISGPGIRSLDASLNKFFRFTERQNLEFRAEFFNLPNHPIFAPPGTTLRTPTYGRITSTKIDSRQLQLALKFNF